MTRNPFDVTKAVDFSDQEIAETYVDFASGSLHELMSPTQALPIFLVGGKGGGRTHLLRRFSHTVRLREDLGDVASLEAAGFLGIYFRCSGLNGARFAGKRQTPEAWSAAFAAYMDLWLAQLLVNSLIEAQNASARAGAGEVWGDEHVRNFIERLASIGDMASLFGSSLGADSLSAVARALAIALRAIDREVNNAAISGRLDITIYSAPGELVFAATTAAQECLPGLAEVKLTFLADEFENLGAEQQKYLNTLIREKARSCTFVVGSRQWGVRTLETLTNDEPNRRGSEFDQVVLEDRYRTTKKEYSEFCASLVANRLRAAGLGTWDQARINRALGAPSRSDTLMIDRLGRDGVATGPRPHLERLRAELEAAYVSSGDASEIVSILSFPANPIIEKWAILDLYRQWSTQGPPSRERAEHVRALAQALLDGDAEQRVQTSWKHWKHDLLAQFYVDSGARAPYYGFEQLVELSGFLPRNLLVLLKNVTRWAQFAGEDPFASDGVIGAEAIQRGITESARWYKTDSIPIGQLGVDIDRAIKRLGQLLRAHRFSPKPVEVACSAFSTDLGGVSEDARHVMRNAKLHGLLVESTRVARNSGVDHFAYQLAPMLAPMFDLSAARRGVLALKSSEVNAVFDPSVTDDEFDGVLSQRLRSLFAPFRSADSAEAIF